jgi:hypothetical protein
LPAGRRVPESNRGFFTDASNQLTVAGQRHALDHIRVTMQADQRPTSACLSQPHQSVFATAGNHLAVGRDRYPLDVTAVGLQSR